MVRSMSKRLGPCGLGLALSLLLGLASAMPAGAQEASRPGVVVAEHGRVFDRFSIDWRRIVDYRVTRLGNRVTVDFVGPVRLDGYDVDAAEHRGLAGLRVEGGRLILHLEPETRIRYYRNGQRFVIDLLPPARPLRPRLAFADEAAGPTR